MAERIDRLWSWACYHCLLAVPTARAPRWLWWWALPWAGRHAYWWSMTDAERAECAEHQPREAADG